MGTWILILTLLGREGAAITPVAGFTTVADCQFAGQQWASNVDEMHQVSRKFTCVPTSATLPKS